MRKHKVGDLGRSGRELRAQEKTQARTLAERMPAIVLEEGLDPFGY